MKKLLGIFLALVIAFSALSAYGCAAPEDKDVALTPSRTPSISCAMFGASTYATVNGKEAISKRISATIYPENATNKSVTYTVEWHPDAERSAENVLDYVEVIQDSEGSLGANVYCYKAFGSDKIIITVTTIDGGLSDTCTVTYAGIASTMTVSESTAPNGSETRNGLSGEYWYALSRNSEYQFTIGLTNVLGDAESYNLEYNEELLDGELELYCADLSNSFAKPDVYEFTERSTTYTNEYKITIKNSELFNVSLSGNVVTVTTTSTSLVNYYSDYSYSLTEHYDDVPLTNARLEFTGQKTDSVMLPTEMAHYAEENEYMFSNHIFELVISDSVSELFVSIRFWIEDTHEILPPTSIVATQAVSLSKETIVF